MCVCEGRGGGNRNTVNDDGKRMRRKRKGRRKAVGGGGGGKNVLFYVLPAFALLYLQLLCSLSLVLLFRFYLLAFFRVSCFCFVPSFQAIPLIVSSMTFHIFLLYLFMFFSSFSSLCVCLLVYWLFPHLKNTFLPLCILALFFPRLLYILIFLCRFLL